MRLLHRLGWQRCVGGILVIAGIGLTALLAFASGAQRPPSQASQVVIALLAAAAQLGAAALFAQNGRPSAGLAQSAARNLLQLFLHLQVLKSETEQLLRKRRTVSEAELRQQLGRVSVALDLATTRTEDAVSNWRQTQPEAVMKAQAELNEGG